MRSIMEMPSDDMPLKRSRGGATLFKGGRLMRSIMEMPSDDMPLKRSRGGATLLRGK